MTSDFQSNAVLSAERTTALARERGLTVDALMTALLPQAAAFASPPISNFRVGVVARGLSGALYAGANYEIAGHALGFTIHAEQSAIANAWMAGERGIDRIAVTAAPCGHCRQFLNELVTAESLVVLLPDGTHPLRALLPGAFGPRDLDVREGLMGGTRHPFVIAEADEVTAAAAEAAAMSYAPYSGAFAGVALRTTGGTIITGAYAENAAFNPSLPPMQTALSQLNLRGSAPASIADAVLVQRGSLHTSTATVVLAGVSGVRLRIVTA